jgi:hypothetical protein
MANLSITAAWNETVDFVRREARLLLPLAFIFVSLPSAILKIFMPMPAAPGEPPAMGAWLVLLPIVFVATIVGNLAMSWLALRPGASVGESIGRGGKRFLPLLGALLLLGLAGGLLFFIAAMVAVVIVPGALASAQAGATTPAMATAAAVTILLILPFLLFVGARMVALTPAAVAEEGGPIALLRRSWRLTAGNSLKLVGFLLLVGIAVSVIGYVVEALFGILFITVAGPIRPGSASLVLVAIVLAIVNTVVAAYLASLIARLYAQLAGKDEA